MTNRKIRAFQHIMESESFDIIKEILPKEWLIREYRPDYGIDLSIEIFKYIDAEKRKAETLGEHLFIQVKSVEKLKVQKIKVKSRDNVAKYKLKEKEEFIEIDVIKHQLETSELKTIQSMGSGVPVLLFYVTLDTRQIFFICLNDLIDKCIIPKDSDYLRKDSKILYIPYKNEIISSYEGLIPIRFFAKRQKLYSAFNLFNYQNEEIGYNYALKNEEFINMIKHFINLLELLDIWKDIEMWQILNIIFSELMQLKKYIYGNNINIYTLKLSVKEMWRRLNILGRNYEELCREWFLPTYMSTYLSYNK
jgi:hypothetical protein